MSAFRAAQYAPFFRSYGSIDEGDVLFSLLVLVSGWRKRSPRLNFLVSATFGETHAYFWARQFAQWLKPSLDAMGVLPGSASDYPKVLMITNACRSGSVHNSSFSVTTEDNKGEGTNVIRLAHRNPAGPSFGTLGTAVPHAFWHNYYGVGYSPSTNKLYFSSWTIPTSHTGPAGWSARPCGSSTTASK